MTPGQSVYLSTTSADLRSACDLLARELRAMKLSVTRADELGPMRDLQRIASSIARCEIFVQLVGSHYGEEPPPHATEFGRVSFGQFEALWAEKCGRQVTYLLLDSSFPCDPAPTERSELTQMQQWYRQHLASARPVLHVHEPADLKSMLRSSIEPEVASQSRVLWQHLANAAVIAFSLIVIGGSAVRLWQHYQPGSPAKTAPVAATTSSAVLDANVPADTGKKKPGWHSVRRLLEIIAEESAIPNPVEMKLHPKHHPIREAVARLTKGRDDYLATYEEALVKYPRHVFEQSSPAAYDRALVHYVAMEFDQAASLSAEAARHFVAERNRSQEPSASSKDDERKAWQLAGHAHMNLGQWDRAIASYTNANALDDPELHPSKRIWLWTWLGLAKAFDQDFVGAEPHFRDIVLHEEERLPAGDLAVAKFINNWAKALAEAGSFEGSATQARRALYMAEQAQQGESEFVAECCEQLAVACIGMKQFGKAEPLLSRARLIWEQYPTVHLSKLATNLDVTGSLLIFMQRPKDAEPVLRRALSLSEKCDGASHPSVGTTLQLLGLMLIQNGNASEARTHLHRAVQILKDFHGPNHPETAVALNNLAFALSICGELHDAWLLSHRAVTIMRDYAATRGYQHPRSAKVMGFAGRMVQFFGSPPVTPPTTLEKFGTPTTRLGKTKIPTTPVVLPSRRKD